MANVTVLRDISLSTTNNSNTATSTTITKQHIVVPKRKPRRSNSVDNTSKRPKIRQVSSIATPHDWVQLRVTCQDMNEQLRWILVIPAGITLYNLHRIIHYCAKYSDDSTIDHWFNIKNDKYGSGGGTTATMSLTADEKAKIITDRKTRFMQVIQNSNDSFEYVYGLLRLTVTMDAIKSGDKQKMDWLPRLCIGSKGTLPPEEFCNDINQIRQFKPRKTVNIDKINKVLMHERFGANQKTNKSTKRDGPSSLLCHAHHDQPHSAITLIYKRPIDGPTEESSSCYTEEDIY
eukprot:TRINITY_DN284_c2_g1_i1.p1 TRINITY_DN284_c2_g1~~TRINITY_DN284_c2_g1_i1.p1  ORF type:complete len:290 (-),score=45.81 TRINITY_DN284_c2_g1_i1:75-944(-)